MAQYRAQGETAPPKEERRDSESKLSLGQVLAATGATTLGTILVKFLDLWGTVLGAAALSICTSIGAVLILRTMQRTGERFKTQIAAISPAAKAGQPRTVDLTVAEPGPNPTRVTATAAVPAAAGEGATRPLDRAEPVDSDEARATEYRAKSASRKRTLVTIAISSVLVFGLTMGVLFLLGGVTGDPGRFINQPAPETATIVEDQDTETGTGTEPDEDATEAEPSDAPEGEEPSPTTGERPDEESPTEAPTSEAPAEDPTEEPTDGGGEDEGGAEESPAPDEQSAEPEAPATE